MLQRRSNTQVRPVRIQTGLNEVKVVLTVLDDSDIHGRCARYDIWAIHAVLGLDLKVQTNRCVLKY